MRDIQNPTKHLQMVLYSWNEIATNFLNVDGLINFSGDILYFTTLLKVRIENSEVSKDDKQ